MKFKLSYLLRVLVMAVLLVSNVTPLLAQNATGAIKGVVKDPQDAVIVNAAAMAIVVRNVRFSFNVIILFLLFRLPTVKR